MWPLDILQVATQSTTAWKFIVPFARDLRRRGHRVTIACSGREFPDAKRYVEEIGAVGFEVIDIDIPRTVSPAGDLRAFGSLLDLLRRRRFDVVHTHNAKAGILGRLAAAIMGVPMVFHTVHGLSAYVSDRYSTAESELHLAIERAATLVTDRLFVVSEAEVRKALAHRVASRPQMTLIGQGIDLEFFDPARVTASEVETFRRQWGLGTGLVVGTVARLVVEKGVETLIDAWPSVLSKHLEARLVVIGDGPERRRLTARASRIADQGTIVFSGFIKDPRAVRAAYAAMDVFALPTRWESFGVAFAEAMAMEVPVVGPQMEPVSSVVGPDAGILVGPRATQLAEAISSLLGSPNLRATTGASGRARAVARFGEDQIFERMVTDYTVLWRRRGGHLRPGHLPAFESDRLG